MWSGGVGPIVIIRLSQFNCNCNCLLELSLAIFSCDEQLKKGRCHSVRLFVRSSVRNLFFLSVSLELVVHLECQQGDSRCLKGVFHVSKVFQRSIKVVSRVFQGN